MWDSLFVILWDPSALGSNSPPYPLQCVPKDFCKFSCTEKFSASSSVKKNATNIFCVPALGGGQEDEEDHIDERALVWGDTQPAFECAAPSL